MLLQNRIILKDNAVLTDISREMSDYNSGTQAIVIVPSEDALYVGSDLPFNHRYFDLSVFNSISGTVAVSIWDGLQFNAAVDVIDLTAVSGKPFAQNGLLMWSTDKAKAWGSEGTTEDMSDLSSFKIYNNYWVKLTFSAAFNPTFKYIGHKFAKDADLSAYYNDLNRASVREAYFEAVTSSWDAIHVAAAEEIVRDLRTQKIVKSVNQIFDPDTFRDCGVHKLAEIVYSSFGPSHADRLDFAVLKYKEAMNKLVFGVDQNADGVLSEPEKIREFRLRRG